MDDEYIIGGLILPMKPTPSKVRMGIRMDEMLYWREKVIVFKSWKDPLRCPAIYICAITPPLEFSSKHI